MLSKLKHFFIKKNSLYIIFVLIILSIIIASLVLRPNINKLHKNSNRFDFYFENIKISELNKGLTDWQIKSKYAKIDNNVEAIFNNLSGVFYYEKKKVIEFTAQHAIFIFDKKITLIKPKAYLYHDKGKLWLTSNKVIWSPIEQVLFGQGNVKIKNESITLTADEMKITVPIKKILLTKRCRAVVKDNFYEE